MQVGYPTTEDERHILILNREEAKAAERDAFQPPELLSVRSIMQARQDILRLHLADELEQYIVNLVVSSRNPGAVDASLEGQILYGASPRASMGIDRAARAHAWLAGRDYVGPEDIQAVAPACLAHRVHLSYEAEAAGKSREDVVAAISQEMADRQDRGAVATYIPELAGADPSKFGIAVSGPGQPRCT